MHFIRGPQIYRSTSSFSISSWSFFYGLLSFGIGLSDRRTGFAQSEAQPPEQTLALSYAQDDTVLPLDPGRQRFTVPHVPAQTGLSRHAAKSSVDSPKMLIAQTPRPPGAFALTQGC